MRNPLAHIAAAIAGLFAGPATHGMSVGEAFEQINSEQITRRTGVGSAKSHWLGSRQTPKGHNKKRLTRLQIARKSKQRNRLAKIQRKRSRATR